MSAPNPVPGAEAPGAPVVGGQATGAGGLAPGATPSSPELWVDVEQLEAQLEQLKEELEAELESECRWIAERLDEIYSGDVYGSYTRNALGTYEDVAFRYPLHAETVESIMRVIDVCKKAETAKLVDYAPDAREVIEVLENAIREEAEKGESEEKRTTGAIGATKELLANLVNTLQEMKYLDFLSDGEEILEKLREYGYYSEAQKLDDAIDVNNVLSDVLVKELRFLGEKFNIEDEVEDLIGCMVGC